jgi:L-cysteine:1D-myo-inositol 2-amino-2-deoxy-alpha-D-glucopyranoside ligase
LHDTRQRAVVPFTPGNMVRMYTCGITPYDAAHVGHAAMVLAYDVVRRRLHDLGHRTQLVRNVTDVDDSILDRARQTGVDWRELGNEQTAYFDDNMRALNVLPSHSEPQASGAIDDIVALTGKLFDTGHAYEAAGQLYFDTASWPRFGELAQLDRATMLELAAERGGNPDDVNKRDPLDFVLWQKSLDDEPSWPSPWGSGRPGWHVECSALVLRELGETIDLHGGGEDLVFPHHECELAQSEAVTGRPFVAHWMHTGMVRFDGEKMSKSLGNLVFVGDLLTKHPAMAVRLAVVGHHYRTEWEWHDELTDAAEMRLENWMRAGRGDAALDAVRAVLDDDLDTPAALELIDEAAARGHGVSSAAALLGVEW